MSKKVDVSDLEHGAWWTLSQPAADLLGYLYHISTISMVYGEGGFQKEKISNEAESFMFKLIM